MQPRAPIMHHGRSKTTEASCGSIEAEGAVLARRRALAPPPACTIWCAPCGDWPTATSTARRALDQPPPVKQRRLCDELPIAAPAENVVVPTPPGAAVGHCARRVSSVEATDTVGKAANVLRLTAVPVVPVVRDGHIVGLMSQSQLSLNNGTSLDTPVEDVMLPPPPPLTSSMAAGLGLAAMEELGLEVAPVVSASGQLVGVVTRADLVALSSRSIRPPRCGGMATPLGVYLTTGMVRAGAGDLGLFLAGALMGAHPELAVIFAAV